MKIAYVTLYFVEHHAKGGVGEKIRTHRNIWQNFGHVVNIFFLSPQNIEFERFQAFQYSSFTRFSVTQFLTRLISRSYALYKMIKAIQKFQPDLIYLRHGIYIYPLQALFHVAPVVLEINSDDLSESALQNKIIYWFTRLTRRISLRLSKGIVYTSHELAEIFSPYLKGKPYCIIANGINLENISPLPPTNNATPVISIVGSPAGSVWHGADKLISLAKQYPDLTINVIGIDEYNQTNIPNNIHFWGFLSREQVQTILAQSDVACGTLALHRKNMYEASSLKVREAAAYGIPLILAYDDTDLSEIKTDYILQIPNTENNIKDYSDTIYIYAWKMIGKRLPRKLIEEYIDQKQKEKKREKFFLKLLSGFQIRIF